MNWNRGRSSVGRAIPLRGQAKGLRRGIVALSTALAAAAPVAALNAQRQGTGASSSAASSLVLNGVTVVDVEQGTLVPAQQVVIVGNRIQAVGKHGAVEVPRGAQVIEATGKYLIPGLWDMHTHVADLPQIFLPLFVANGVTGIRDMHQSFFPFDSVLQWRRDILAGRRVGPRLVATGGFLTTAAPGTFEGAPRAVHVSTAAEATRAVDSLKAAGVDFIKVREMESRDVFFAIVAAARRAGLPLVGHRPEWLPSAEASDSGMRSMEHYGNGPCREADSAGTATCRELVTHFLRNGTWFTPTMVTQSLAYLQSVAAERARYWSEATRAEAETGQVGTYRMVVTDSSYASENLPLRQRALRGMRRFGAPLLAGTDASKTYWEAAPGFGLHDELALFVDAGLTPLDALQAATINPAKMLGGTDSLGTVAPGKLADLVLLDADPLADIHNATMIRAVVANGRYFDRAALDALLAGVEATAKQMP